MITQGETLLQAMVEPTESPTKERQLQEPTNPDNTEDTPDQRDWWDDADVSGLIDTEAFCHFLYGYDQLL